MCHQKWRSSCVLYECSPKKLSLESHPNLFRCPSCSLSKSWRWPLRMDQRGSKSASSASSAAIDIFGSLAWAKLTEAQELWVLLWLSVKNVFKGFRGFRGQLVDRWEGLTLSSVCNAAQHAAGRSTEVSQKSYKHLEILERPWRLLFIPRNYLADLMLLQRSDLFLVHGLYKHPCRASVDSIVFLPVRASREQPSSTCWDYLNKQQSASSQISIWRY